MSFCNYNNNCNINPITTLLFCYFLTVCFLFQCKVWSWVKNTHTYIHTMCMCECAHIIRNRHPHAYTHKHMHVCVHEYTHILAGRHTHLYTYTHTLTTIYTSHVCSLPYRKLIVLSSKLASMYLL